MPSTRLLAVITLFYTAFLPLSALLVQLESAFTRRMQGLYWSPVAFDLWLIIAYLVPVVVIAGWLRFDGRRDPRLSALLVLYAASWAWIIVGALLTWSSNPKSIEMALLLVIPVGIIFSLILLLYLAARFLFRLFFVQNAISE